jgi:hypothetical protein
MMQLISSSPGQLPGTGIAYTCASGHTTFGYIPGMTGNTRILNHPAGHAESPLPVPDTLGYVAGSLILYPLVGYTLRSGRRAA